MNTRCTKPKRSSSNSRNSEEEKSEPIPFDLIIEILTRLPAKSVARFRFVSKLWESTIRIPNFTESFFAISSSRPKLLFTILKNADEASFFSSPQPQSSSPNLAVNFHMSFNFQMSFPVYSLYELSPPVCGLVCVTLSNGNAVTVPLICNPSTGKSLTLPTVRTIYKEVKSYFGYDPINKQLKVLCMSIPYFQSMAKDHQVLTLETGKELSWRMIQCDISYNPISYKKDICINGVLYYFAWLLPDADSFPDIICFDIRSEKFFCIQKPQGMMNHYTSNTHMGSTLVNYKGKIAMLHPIVVDYVCTSIQLWVSEDTDKHQWSSHIYVLPVNNIEVRDFCIVGMTGTSEIVLSMSNMSDSFYSTTIPRGTISQELKFKEWKALSIIKCTRF